MKLLSLAFALALFATGTASAVAQINVGGKASTARFVLK